MPRSREFEQAPEKHIIGNGCPKCIGRHKTPQEVLSDFGNAHGDKYDYSKVIFSLLGKKLK